MGKKKEYLKVGSYTPPDSDGNGEKIVREFYGQGMILPAKSVGRCSTAMEKQSACIAVKSMKEAKINGL